MPSLCFVTPAFRRFALTEICLRQRRALCDELAEQGIYATSVVVADDDNLDTARGFGFGTVERDNEWLGRKFNDGYEWAARRGIDYVFPIGSDMWAAPSMFAELAEEPTDQWHMHRAYSLVPPSGDRRADLFIPIEQGCLRAMATETLRHVGYRPCEEHLPRGCDGSTWERGQGSAQVVEHDCRALELIGFQSPDVQLSDYVNLRRFWAYIEEREQPFAALREVYLGELVDAIEKHYAVAARGR